jgi:hypothetical protein
MSKLESLLTKEQKAELIGTNQLALCVVEKRHGRTVVKGHPLLIETVKVSKPKDVKEIKDVKPIKE